MEAPTQEDTRIEIDEILDPNAKPKGERPFFFDDPAVERVLSITMAVAGELAVMRERLDTIERLLDEQGVVRQEDVEQFEPDADAAEERQEWHAKYIARILRILQQDREEIENSDEHRPLDEIAEELSRT
jgi:predicted  nucleic acid-binding Zn-ribbon protein